MARVEIYTNYISGNEKIKQKIEKALKEGNEVRIGSSCIGHTRAEMVMNDGKRFMEELGAKPVYKDLWGTYYALTK